jgi:predicted Zn-dependent protease
MALGRLDEAYEVLDQLGREHPTSPWVHLGRAILALHVRDWGSATSEVDEALRLDPGPEALFRAGSMLLEIPGSRERAISLPIQAAEAGPLDVGPRQFLAALLAKEDPERAR